MGASVVQQHCLFGWTTWTLTNLVLQILMVLQQFQKPQRRDPVVVGPGGVWVFRSRR